MLKMGEMWLAKVARRGENLVQYVKISLDIVLDAKTFDNQVKAHLQVCFQGRSRRLLREPLLAANKRTTEPKKLGCFFISLAPVREDSNAPLRLSESQNGVRI